MKYLHSTPNGLEIRDYKTDKPEKKDYDDYINYIISLTAWEAEPSYTSYPVPKHLEHDFLSLAYHFKTETGDIKKVLAEQGIPIPDEAIQTKLVYRWNEGNYMGFCCLCKGEFIGDKRQPVCKKCCEKEYAFLVEKVEDKNNEAIEFAEFLRLNFQNAPAEFDNYWEDFRNFPNNSGKCYTTKELYELYLKTK